MFYNYVASLGLLLTLFFLVKYKIKAYYISTDEFVQAAVVVGFFSYFGSHIGWMFRDGVTATEQASMMNWLAFYKGGQSATGLLGAILAVVLVCLWHKKNIFNYISLLIEAGLVTLAFVRIGCSYNHEHLGIEAPKWLGYTDQFGIYRHDLGLYECLFLWLCFIPNFLRHRRNIYNASKFTIQFTISFLIFRFVLEFIRQENFQSSQFKVQSIYVILAFTIFIFRNHFYLKSGDLYEDQKAS